jgi:hypothetical protein
MVLNLNLQDFDEKDIQLFIQDVRKAEKKKYILIMCEILIGIFLVVLISPGLDFYRQIVLLIGFGFTGTLLGYTLFEGLKLRNIELASKTILHFKPEKIHLSKKYILGIRKNIYLKNSCSLTSEQNGICLIKFIEKTSILSNKINTPSVPYITSFNYKILKFKVARMIKNCQISHERNYASKGKALVYFVQNKEIKDNIDSLLYLFDTFYLDTSEKKPLLEKESNMSIILTVIIPLVVLAILKILWGILSAKN